MSTPPAPTPWVDTNSALAMEVIQDAYKTRRPVVFLLGAGVSADAGIPLASQLKEYLTQMHQLVRDEGFSNARQYVEETRWPSRHDLRVDLMLREKDKPLAELMERAERLATQASMLSEVRREAPMLASSLQEIFGQLDGDRDGTGAELRRLYGEAEGLARTLGRRSPRNIAYRSMLFHLCDRNQTTIDACLDHFMRDRAPTTPHQFVYFLTRLLNCRVILTTNFDQLLEMAFAGEGLMPRVYEVHGEGSIPSGQLLLSQPLSVVKLHGGAHQMRTGFDLDDPLSPAALSTFSELFRQLSGKRDPHEPLVIALGYSGSDRRVMDIVTNHVREWRSAPPGAGRGGPYQPQVLWVSREAWPPDLLRSAVRTHPEVLQRGDTATDPRQFPAHVVRFRDGRMFLLEAIQRLTRHFPIARSFYQAVNFVQHSTEPTPAASPVPPEPAGDWRLAMIHSPRSAGGSSSRLVATADRVEKQDVRTIWIDLTEVAGVAALLDVLSERLTKLDSRLQPIRRPPVLQGLSGRTDAAGTPRRVRSRAHELRAAAQWLRHALRRGRYLVALDSLDEFPSRHPAVDDVDEEGFEKDQRTLLGELLHALLKDPALLGESRVAVAVSHDDEKCHGPAKHPAAPCPLCRMLDDFRKLSGSDGRVVYLKVADPPAGGAGAAPDNRVPPPAGGGTHFDVFFPARRADEEDEDFRKRRYRCGVACLVVLVACAARRIRSEVMLLRCVSELIGRLVRPGEVKDDDEKGPGTLMDKLLDYFTGTPAEFFGGVARRLDTVLWTEWDHGTQHPTDKGYPQLDQDILDVIRGLAGYAAPPRAGGAAAGVATIPTTYDATHHWLYRTEGAYHWMHRDVRDGLYQYVGGLKLPDPDNAAAAPAKGGVVIQAAVHHIIALFSYDELYERSRDARSFLEYLFHRIASIRKAIAAKRPEYVYRWVHRLVLALQREKHALLARVRLPSLIRMLVQLTEIIHRDALVPLFTDCEASARVFENPINNYRHDLRSLLAEFFVACGYPHSAYESLRRCPAGDPEGDWNETTTTESQKPVFDMADDLNNLEQEMHASWAAQRTRHQSAPGNSLDPHQTPPAVLPGSGPESSAKPGRPAGRRSGRADPAPPAPAGHGVPTPGWAKEFDRRLRVRRDLAFALQDPILFTTPLLPLNTRTKDAHDWTDRYDEPPGGPPRSGGRSTRLRIADTIYHQFILREKQRQASSNRLEKNWAESDDEGDLMLGMVRRILEFRLIWYGSAWVASAEVYWYREDAAEYLGRLKEFEGKQQSLPTESGPLGNKDTYFDTDAPHRNARLLWGEHPILRSSGRRRRNECHRLCLRARLDVAKTLDKLEDGTALRTYREWGWERVRRSLEAAEAILSRGGDPADRQARAVTRLTTAELLIRLAETHWKYRALDAADEHTNRAPDAANEHTNRALGDLAEATGLLSTVDELLNEGRGENRWRFFYLLTRARSHMLDALIKRDDRRRQALLQLHWAARHLVGAFANCGLWTDRYDVLGWWWDTWQSLANSFYPDQRVQYDEYLREMKARLGIRWRSETNARRSDRRL